MDEDWVGPGGHLTAPYVVREDGTLTVVVYTPMPAYAYLMDAAQAAHWESSGTLHMPIASSETYLNRHVLEGRLLPPGDTVYLVVTNQSGRLLQVQHYASESSAG